MKLLLLQVCLQHPGSPGRWLCSGGSGCTRVRLTYPSSSAVSMYVRLCGSLLESNRRSAWAQKDRLGMNSDSQRAVLLVVTAISSLWLIFLWVMRVAEIDCDQDREKWYLLSQSCCFLVLLYPPLGHSSIFAPLTCKETSSKSAHTANATWESEELCSWIET